MGPEQQYLQHLQAGRFMLMRSRSNGRCFFHPRVAAPGSGETDLEWVPASGRAEVYATTVIRQKPPAQNYNLAIVQLEEGPRMMSRVDGIAPEAVRIGMPLRAEVIRENDVALVVFLPADGGGAR